LDYLFQGYTPFRKYENFPKELIEET